MEELPKHKVDQEAEIEYLGMCSTVSTPEDEKRLLAQKSGSEAGSGGKWKKFWQNFHKPQKGAVQQTSKAVDLGFVAREITMSDEECIELMKMVKEKKITIEEALAHVKEYETQYHQSCTTDTTEWTAASSPTTDELPVNPNSQEESDAEQEELAFGRPPKPVNSRPIKTDKKHTSKDFTPTGEEKPSLYSRIKKRLVVSWGDGMASAPRVDGDPDSLTTPTSTSNLDIYSGLKQFNPFNSSQALSYPPTESSVDTSMMGAGSCSSFSGAEGGCEEKPRITCPLTDGEMRQALSSSALHRSDSGTISRRDAARSPTQFHMSLRKMVNSVKETMRKCKSKKSSAVLFEQLGPNREPEPLQSPHTNTHSLEKPKLVSDGPVENLRSSLRGQSSMSGQKVSTTDSSNRESVKSKAGDDKELPYRGPFCGRARVNTDFIPSPYDPVPLKLKRGDIIQIISKPPTGTWTGLLNNKVGTFKFIYVDVLKDKKPKSSTRKSLPPKPRSLEELLERINLKGYLPIFLFNGYEDLEIFKLLEEEDLDELEITDPQHREALMTEVELLQEYDSNNDPMARH